MPTNNTFSEMDTSKLADDLLWIRDMAGSGGWLKNNLDFVCNRLIFALENQSLYPDAVDTILDLLALALQDAQHRTAFELVVEAVRLYPTQLSTPFQSAFRSVIEEFQKSLSIYASLATAPPRRVDDLLQAYIRLLRVLSFNHGMRIQRDLIDQALDTARQLNDHMENARLNQVLALYYTQYGDWTLAEHHGKRAFGDYEYVEDEGGIADAACTLAIIYRAQLRLPRVAFYIDRALGKIKDKPQDKRFATLYYEKGALSYLQKKYELALAFYQRALAIFEEHEAVHQLAMTQQALAQVYIYQHDYENAEAFLHCARRGWEKLDNKYDLVNSYFVEGDMELHRGRRDEALQIFAETIKQAYALLEDTPGRSFLIQIIEERIEAESTRV